MGSQRSGQSQLTDNSGLVKAYRNTKSELNDSTDCVDCACVVAALIKVPSRTGFGRVVGSVNTAYRLWRGQGRGGEIKLTHILTAEEQKSI